MVAAEIVNALQTIVSREISPYEPAVITVGELHGGTARNVIAGTAYLTGTVRTYGDKTHEEMPELMRRIVEHTAAALGAEAELTDYTIANYKVENDAASSERCRQAVLKCWVPRARGGHYRGTLSGEDFSEYLRRVPVCSPLSARAIPRSAPPMPSTPASIRSTRACSPRAPS